MAMAASLVPLARILMPLSQWVHRQAYTLNAVDPGISWAERQRIITPKKYHEKSQGHKRPSSPYDLAGGDYLWHAYYRYLE
jgi:hypothetical protein